MSHYFGVKYFVYLLNCADGTLYCGYTVDLAARLKTHNAGKGAKYTRSRLPVALVYFEEYETKHEAMSREWHIKRLSREEKQALVAGGTPWKRENKEEEERRF